MPKLSEQFAHLGRGGSATVQPVFSGMEWYEAYGARTAADGIEGRLVSHYDFAESWTSWECHPHGAELVICTAGAITLIQEQPDGNLTRVPLGPGEYAINPPGIWHTADVAPGETATAIFITAGLGTKHRPRMA
jgi:hypothetical protein